MRNWWRGLLLAVIALPANAFLLAQNWNWGQSNAQAISIFYNVVASLFLLVLLNEGIRLLFKRPLLRPADIIFFYAAMCTATALGGDDWLVPMFDLVVSAHWLANPANLWAERICPYLPELAVQTDRLALKAFYDVGYSFWSLGEIAVWFGPLLFWWLLTCLLVGAMLCLSVIFRREWTERMRMTFPLVEVPRLLILQPRSLFKSGLFWFGFGVAVVVDALNGLHFKYPLWPDLGGGWAFPLSRLFTGRMALAMGWAWLTIHPFAIGLTYFVPLELSFSFWFFFWLAKVQGVVAVLFGYQPHGYTFCFPYTREQSLGAFLVLAFFSFWVSRKAFGRALKNALALRLKDAESKAALLLILCFFGLLLLGRALKLPFWVNFLAFSLYLATSVAMARIRAELGPPFHDLSHAGPNDMFPRFFGTKVFTKEALGGLTMFYAFTRVQRAHPMPHQVEAFKLAHDARSPAGGVVWAVVLGFAFGFLCNLLMYLHIKYRYGGGPAGEPYQYLENWFSEPKSPEKGSIIAFFLGAGFTYFLYLMATRFTWWPFHPVGYAVTLTYDSMGKFWFSIFIGWALKGLILRYGGLHIHRRASAFFAGLVVGEFLTALFWAILGNIAHEGMYRFIW